MDAVVSVAVKKIVGVVKRGNETRISDPEIVKQRYATE